MGYRIGEGFQFLVGLLKGGGALGNALFQFLIELADLRFHPVALVAGAQNVDAERQIAREFLQEIDFVRREGSGFRGIDG